MSWQTGIRYQGAFIGGEHHANGGDALPVTDPATGQVFADVPIGTEEDVDAAARPPRPTIRHDRDAMVVRAQDARTVAGRRRLLGERGTS